MPVHLGWQEILLRLILTVIAGTVIGFNRGEHSQPAGLRTTLLVCLAAAISMIQANLLLETAGKSSDSFVTLDLMRLPLGILTGMGFIGGGAILKKGDVVLGVTTAATLWFVTVIGLCFGGGQHALGGAALAIGVDVLSLLKHVEALLPVDRRATLTVTASLDGLTEEEIHALIFNRGLRIESSGVCFDRDGRKWTLFCDVRWRARSEDPSRPTIVRELSRLAGVSRLEWSTEGAPGRPIPGRNFEL